MMKLIRNRDGNAAIIACVVILVLFLVFSLVSEYLRLQLITKGVRDATQSAVISVATQNYDDVYNGLREGYSGGYTLDQHDVWVKRVDSGAVLSNLSEVLGLIGGSKYTNGYLEYAISNINIDVKNPDLAPSGNIKRFESSITIDLLVPLSFGWGHLEPLKLKLKVDAGYTPKF